MIDIDISRASRDTHLHRSRSMSKLAWIEGPRMVCLFGLLVLLLQSTPSWSFQFQQQRSFSVLPTVTTTASTARHSHQHQYQSLRLLASSSDDENESNAAPTPYVPIKGSQPLGKRQKALVPMIGDVVRYYDLDGGESKGEVLVGKISYIFGSRAYGGFSVELYELEDVGDGYFAEYSSALQSRRGRKTERRLEAVSPVAASFVGSEQAYKIPLESNGKSPRVRQETYDIDEYEGPAFYASVDANVLERDADNYQALKSKLFRNVLLTGLVGTIVTNASYGAELAIIYFSGSLASLLYLFLLSVKTDTVAVNSEDNTKNLAGTPIANLRFGTPILVLLGVSLWNTQKMSSGLGGGGDEFSMKMFDTVSQDQFGAVVLGFLTYRLPLFVGQIRDAFQAMDAENAAESALADDGNGSSGVQLPGSAGVAARLLGRGRNNDEGASASSSAAMADDLVTILLVSGPQATGRQELVQRLLESSSSDYSESGSKLVTPKRVFRNNDGATYERLERRNEFLDTDESNQSGLTSDGILDAARGLLDGKEIPNKNAVVVDASVELAKTLAGTNLGGNTRLISVWVGLQSVKDFEARLEADIASGKLVVPEDDTKESFLRGKIKDIINEIDFGLGSGIFEFTILNDASDPEKSLKELKEAASYAFK